MSGERLKTIPGGIYIPNYWEMKELLEEKGLPPSVEIEAKIVADNLNHLSMIADTGKKRDFWGRQLYPADTQIIVATRNDARELRSRILNSMEDGLFWQKYRSKSKLLLVVNIASDNQGLITEFVNRSLDHRWGRNLVGGGYGHWGEQGLEGVPARLILGGGVWPCLERFQGPTSGPQLELEGLFEHFGRYSQKDQVTIHRGKFSVYQIDANRGKLAQASSQNFPSSCRVI